MTTYNPYTTQQRHRRTQVRQGLSLREFAGCVGITLATILAMFAAALI